MGKIHSKFAKLSVMGSILMCLTTSSFAVENNFEIEASNDEEAFLIRRIAEFWKDGDFAIVKSQIEDFFQKYPDSHLKDYFQGILGDLYLQENNYQAALTAYSKINDTSVKDKIFLNKLQCLYELSHYGKLSTEALPFLENLPESCVDRKDEFHFLIAESLFRQALTLDNVALRTELMKKAQPFYQSLLSSSYAEVSSLALAEIYRVVGSHEIASNLYLELSKSNPEKQEALLYQAGAMQAHFDKEGALGTFEKVIAMNGERASEAAYNRLVLLFETEKYEEVIEKYEQVKESADEPDLATINYIVGKSYFALDNFQNALAPLKECIESQDSPSPQLRNALLLSMTCAHHMYDETMFEHSYEKFEALYPADSELPKAIFMHAMILKENGNSIVAEEKLKLLMLAFSTFDDQENLIYEYSFLTHENEKWNESYKTLSAYLNQFPESIRIDSAWKLFLSSSLHLYQESMNSNHISYSKKQFQSDLMKILEVEDLLTVDQKMEYQLLYATIAYELGNYQNSHDYLHRYILTHQRDETHPEFVARAHYIAALCHEQMNTKYTDFSTHLEAAIKLHPEVHDTSANHLRLFNAFISLSGEIGMDDELEVTQEDQKQEFKGLAADHLYRAIALNETPIKGENKLWLANYYYDCIKHRADKDWRSIPTKESAHSEWIERGMMLYGQVLITEQSTLVMFTKDSLALEPETLKYAELAEVSGDNALKISLIKNLIQQQNNHPNWDWKFEKETLYELACSYEASGDYEKALETFTFLRNKSNRLQNPLDTFSTFHSARLQFAMLDEAAKVEHNESVISILNYLKELQIRKNAYLEPIHLEAALEYAQIRSILAANYEKESRHIFFLKRMKEDFSSADDNLSKEYHRLLGQDPKKQALFQNYMKFVDAEIYRLHGKQKFKEEKLAEMEEYNENSLALFNEIKDLPTTPKELHKRVCESIEEINRLIRY